MMNLKHLIAATVFVTATAAIPATSEAQFIPVGIPTPHAGNGGTVPISGTSRGLSDRAGQRSMLPSERARGKDSPTGSIGIKTDAIEDKLNRQQMYEKPKEDQTAQPVADESTTVRFYLPIGADDSGHVPLIAPASDN
jgi:hypothetical protein